MLEIPMVIVYRLKKTIDCVFRQGEEYFVTVNILSFEIFNGYFRKSFFSSQDS